MPSYYRDIFLRALADTPGLVSSNWLAVLLSGLTVFVIFTVQLLRQPGYKEADTLAAKWIVIRERWVSNLRDGVVVAGVLWLMLFVISLSRTLYRDHTNLTQQASELVKERNAVTQQRDAFLQQRDSLQHEIDALKSQPAQIKVQTLPAQKMPDQCWFSNHFGMANSTIKGAMTATAVIFHCNHKIPAPFQIVVEFDRDFIPSAVVLTDSGAWFGGSETKSDHTMVAKIDNPAILSDQLVVATVYGSTDQYPRALRGGIQEMK